MTDLADIQPLITLMREKKILNFETRISHQDAETHNIIADAGIYVQVVYTSIRVDLLDKPSEGCLHLTMHNCTVANMVRIVEKLIADE